MSSEKHVIISCGSSQVDGCVFVQESGRLKLISLESQQIDADPTSEESWIAALSDALKKLRTRFNFPGQCTLIAPGNLLLTKTLKVPSVEKAKQAQIIAFEAGENIPYPLSEVVWDYEIVGNDGVETEVLLIFVKADVIYSLCKTFVNNGFKPKAVTAASILDANTYRYINQGDQPDTLFVSINARSTNLLFFSSDSFLVNSIAYGEATLYQGLADRLGVPVKAAADLMEQYASAADGIDVPTQAILKESADNFIKRINQEITKRIINYRRQKNAKALERILFAGHGSCIPGLAEKVSEIQKTPASVFDPLESVELDGGVNPTALAASRSRMSAPVGLIASKIIQNPVSIDLMPPSLASEMQFTSQKPVFAIAALVCASATVFPWLHFASRTQALESEVSALNAAVQPLRANNEELLEKIQATQNLQSKIQKLEGLVASRSNWIEFLADLQKSLQDVGHVWLESLDYTSNKKAQLSVSGRLLIHDFDSAQPNQGFTRAKDRVNKLIGSFRKSAFIQDVTDAQFDTGNPRIMGFTFTLVINPEKPLSL